MRYFSPAVFKPGFSFRVTAASKPSPRKNSRSMTSVDGPARRSLTWARVGRQHHAISRLTPAILPKSAQMHEDHSARKCRWMKDVFEDLRSAIARPSSNPPSIYGLGTTSHPNWRVAHFFAGHQSAAQTSSKVRHQVRLQGRR
jgi:hypothetical protein